MKLTFDRDYDAITLEFTENFFATFHCDWVQVIKKFNWYSMHFVMVYAENDVMTGGVECEMWLLGFGMRVRWNYDPSKLDEMGFDAESFAEKQVENSPTIENTRV